MPAISSIKIENYRGFYKEREFVLARPNGANGSGLTILVGPNNSGKSSVLNAVRLVLVPRQVDMEHRHDGYPLKITLTNDAGEDKIVSNPDLGANLDVQGNRNGWPTFNDFRLVPSRRGWAPYTNQQTMGSSDYWSNTFNRQPSDGEDSFLVSRVAQLDVDERKSFDSLLRELLPQLNTWRIEQSRGQTFILYFTQSGARHAADLFGDGMASLFRIAMALFDSRDGYVVAVDEPELSLHPQAQKLLASVMSRYAADRQIVITTHSPYFVNWSDISNGAKVYRLTQERDGISVGALGQKTLHDLRGLVSDWQKPNLLDAVSREVFFADGVVFFEGQEDVGLLRKFAADKKLEPIPAFGYGAGGAGNIIYFLRMAEDLKIPAAAVYDGDHADLKDVAAAKFPYSLVELLPTPDIRDKHKRDENTKKDADEIEKQGLFDRRGDVKPEFVSYLTELFKRLTSSIAR